MEVDRGASISYRTCPASSSVQDALVADAAGDLALVEVAEEGQGVLAAGVEEVADAGDGDRPALVDRRLDLVDEDLVDVARVDQVRRDLDQLTALDQRLGQLGRHSEARLQLVARRW